MSHRKFLYTKGINFLSVLQVKVFIFKKKHLNNSSSEIGKGLSGNMCFYINIKSI